MGRGGEEEVRGVSQCSPREREPQSRTRRLVLLRPAHLELDSLHLAERTSRAVECVQSDRRAERGKGRERRAKGGVSELSSVDEQKGGRRRARTDLLKDTHLGLLFVGKGRRVDVCLLGCPRGGRRRMKEGGWRQGGRPDALASPLARPPERTHAYDLLGPLRYRNGSPRHLRRETEREREREREHDIAMSLEGEREANARHRAHSGGSSQSVDRAGRPNRRTQTTSRARVELTYPSVSERGAAGRVGR